MTDKKYHMERFDPVLSLNIKPPSLHSWIVSDNIKLVSESFLMVSYVDVKTTETGMLLDNVSLYEIV